MVNPVFKVHQAKSYWSLISGIYRLSSADNRRTYCWILLAAATGAISEITLLIGVAPFVNIILRNGSSSLSIDSGSSFSYIFRGRPGEWALIGMALIIASTLTRLWSTKTLAYGAGKIGSYIGLRLFKKILGLEFEDAMLSDHSKLTNTIAMQSNQIVNGGIRPILSAISGCISATLIFASVGFVDPFIFFVAVLTLSLVYFLTTKLIKPLLDNNSRLITDMQEELLRILRNTLSDYRAICITGTAGQYFKEFSTHNSQLRDAQSQTAFIAALPKIAIEGAIALMVGAFIVFSYKSGEFFDGTKVFILLVIFQRSVPLLQQVISSYSLVRSNSAALSDIIELASESCDGKVILDNRICQEPMSGRSQEGRLQSIILDEVSFGYKGIHRNILDSVSICMHAGNIYGVVGRSGSGKTTFIDIVSCLLTPTSGTVNFLLKNGRSIPGGQGALHILNSLGIRTAYCSQRPYIIPGSIAENLLLGACNNYEEDWLFTILEAVCLQDLALNRLGNIYTCLGENGSLLSGGQAQRLGVARALVQKPDILILDECTSGLDQETERKMLRNIINILPDALIILSTHSKEVMEICNHIININETSSQASFGGVQP